MKGFALMAQFTFQPSRTYAEYDLASLVSVPDIDETLTVVLASVDKSMTIPRKTFVIQMGR
jgi:hypothetical protein